GSREHDLGDRCGGRRQRVDRTEANDRCRARRQGSWVLGLAAERDVQLVRHVQRRYRIADLQDITAGQQDRLEPRAVSLEGSVHGVAGGVAQVQPCPGGSVCQEKGVLLALQDLELVRIDRGRRALAPYGDAGLQLV